MKVLVKSKLIILIITMTNTKAHLSLAWYKIIKVLIKTVSRFFSNIFRDNKIKGKFQLMRIVSSSINMVAKINLDSLQFCKTNKTQD